MSGFKKYYRNFERAAEISLLACVAATWACGSTFGSPDCKVSRTCVEDAGESGGEGGESGTGPVAGASPSEGGAPASMPECTKDPDCSNGDAADGEETCVAGECQAGDTPPRIVSVSPAEREEGVEPNAPIVIEFSEALATATVTAETVRLLDGETPLAGKLTYEGKVATFVPELPLTLLASFEVVVSDAVTDEAGTALVDPYRSTFTVRDGAWHVMEAAPGRLNYVSPTLPLLPNGSVLLAWSGIGTNSCPVKVAWLDLAATAVTPQPFVQDAEYCDAPLAAAGADGVGITSWGGGGLSYVQQYREGTWSSSPLQVTLSSESYVIGLAVSPLGVVTRFLGGDTGGIAAVRTDAAGKWSETSDPIAAEYALYSYGKASVAFDREGNGLAAFKARDETSTRLQTITSRFTMASGKWSPAQAIVGSESEAGAIGFERGAPVLAVSPAGPAMLVWYEGPSPGRLMSSRFDPETGWSEAELVSSTIKVTGTGGEQAALTFDGQRFAAAWLGVPDDGVRRVFTASYDPEQGWDSPVGHDAKKELPVLEHPSIVSDEHGSLLLVWLTGTSGDYTTVQRRFVAGAWQAIEPLPQGARAGAALSRATLVMNASGIAAMTWPTEDAQNQYVSVHVARFY